MIKYSITSISFWSDFNHHRRTIPPQNTQISIPFWSDFNHHRRTIPPQNTQISIPFWSDFNGLLVQDSVPARRISIPFWSDFNALVEIIENYIYEFQSHFGLILTKGIMMSYISTF